MENTAIKGFLAINKPRGKSSFDCIKHIKKLLPKKTKIGHAGTLDKEADGLLILAISREATKMLSLLTNASKHYLVEAKLGELTDTLDYNGTILKTSDVSHITSDDILDSITKMGHEYTQIPPIYSALKYQGKSLYKIARRHGNTEELEKIVQQKSRIVKLYELKLLSFDCPNFTFHAHVSKGTYIRSLANDIAKHMSTYATTYKLTRTQIGDIKLDDATNIDDIKSVDDLNVIDFFPEISN